MSIINSPVLLIGFNRPDTMQKVFNCIQEVKPKNLYIALDGPRENNDDDNTLCKRVKNIIQDINWDCNVHHKINKENKGAEITISLAISWVLENEEHVIILEDDVVAPVSFFNFAQEMLIKYRDNDSISYVSGNNFTPISLPNNEDYPFAKYGHYAGSWGTWKRSWKHFDLCTKIINEKLEYSYLKSITNSKKEAKYFKRLFKTFSSMGTGNCSWDQIALYNHITNQKLAIIPKVHLNSNIGIYGLHASGKADYHFLPFDKDFRVRIHPQEIKCNTEYDINHFNNYIYHKNPLFVRIANKIKQIGSQVLNK